MFREARGIVSECSTKRQFEVFFDLLCVWEAEVTIRFPSAFNIMRQALHQRPNDTEVVSAVLKFLNSLTWRLERGASRRLNKESRVDYCNDRGMGVTLFRETSKVLLEYGNILLASFPSFVRAFASRES